MTNWQGADAAFLEASHARLLAAIADWDEDDTKLVNRAVRTMVNAHGDQRRDSGEPYACHPLEVAAIVAVGGGDTDMLIAALLHDAVEDTEMTLEQIAGAYGPAVATMVDGCTKVDSLEPRHTGASQAATMRKLIVALARDPRVIAVKLADRLHNMRTLGPLDHERKVRMGQETLAVHGPLAGRLGLAGLKAELEDLAFSAADPAGYARTVAALADPRLASVKDEVMGQLEAVLLGRGVDAQVQGRTKHAWSAHRKARSLGVPVMELADLVGVRVLTAEPEDCYRVLGLVHATWPPVPGKFKDYIAVPKFNSYQSLHTVVAVGGVHQVEVQIRTHAMHEASEHGRAAHHAYKTPEAAEPAWLSRLLERNTYESDNDYLAGLHRELAADDEVLVLTRDGDAVALPVGATVIDFAYAVHTEVGHACSGADVNGVPVPLETVLVSGDKVVVHSGRVTGPDPQWLEQATTSRARARIKDWHRRLKKAQAVERGQVLVEDAARVSALDTSALLADVPADLLEHRYEQVGRGRLPAAVMLEHLASASAVELRSVLYYAADPTVKITAAACCRPMPPSPVTGLSAAGGAGVHAHATTCRVLLEALARTPGRQAVVRWAVHSASWTVVEVTAVNRTGLLADVAARISAAGGDIESSTTQVHADGTCREVFEVTAGEGVSGRDIAAAVRDVPGVRTARAH